MAQKKYLDQNGLSYLWDKIKAYIASQFPVPLAKGGTGKTSAVEGNWALQNRGYCSDANTALSVGIYNTNTSTLNLPALAYSQNNGCGVLICYVSNASTHNNRNNWIWQLWLNTTTSDLHKRKKINAGTWGAWSADTDTAATLKTPRTLNVSGQATGTAQSFDGSQNVSIPITLYNTQGLARPFAIRGTVDDTLQSLFNATRANRLAFLPADQIIIEKTVDGGVTWTDAGVSDAVKQGLFSETRPSVYIPKIDGVRSPLCGIRVTLTAMKYAVPDGTLETEKYNYWNSENVIVQERYNQLREFYFWISGSDGSIGIKIEGATGAQSTNWNVLFDNPAYSMTGWSGSDYVRLNRQYTFGGIKTQTANKYWNYRMTFMSKGKNGTDDFDTGSKTQSQFISEIRGYGFLWWTKGNEYAANDKIYTHDIYQNVTFPAKVTAESFAGSLNGNATTVNSHTVQSDVPANAAFTDTTYALSQDAEDGHKITLTPSAGNPATITIPDNDTTYSPATSSADGLMSAADKEKLDNMSCTRVYDDTLEYKTQSGWSPVDITLQPFTAVAETSVEWELGVISSSSGANSNSSTRLRTVSYLPANILEITPASGYRFVLMAYDNGTYIGAWNGTSYAKTATWLTDKVEASDLGQHDFRIVLARNPDSGTMTVDEKSGITITQNVRMTVNDLAKRTISLEKALMGIDLSDPESAIYALALRVAQLEAHAILDSGYPSESSS